MCNAKALFSFATPSCRLGHRVLCYKRTPSGVLVSQCFILFVQQLPLRLRVLRSRLHQFYSGHKPPVCFHQSFVRVY